MFLGSRVSVVSIVASAWRVNVVIDLLSELGESVLRIDITSINGYNT